MTYTRYRSSMMEDDGIDGMDSFLRNLPQILFSIVIIMVVYGVMKFLSSPVGASLGDALGALVGIATEAISYWQLFIIGWLVIRFLSSNFATWAGKTIGRRCWPFVYETNKGIIDAGLHTETKEKLDGVLDGTNRGFEMRNDLQRILAGKEMPGTAMQDTHLTIRLYLRDISMLA